MNLADGFQSFFEELRQIHPGVENFRLKVGATQVKGIPRKITASNDLIATGMTDTKLRYRIGIGGDVVSDSGLADKLSGLSACQVSFDGGRTYQDVQIVAPITNNGIYWELLIEL